MLHGFPSIRPAIRMQWHIVPRLTFIISGAGNVDVGLYNCLACGVVLLLAVLVVVIVICRCTGSCVVFILGREVSTKSADPWPRGSARLRLNYRQIAILPLTLVFPVRSYCSLAVAAVYFVDFVPLVRVL